MTYEEKLMLNDFLGKLVSVNNISKDPEADMLIKKAFNMQPDAGYILVQNMLLMQVAVTELKKRVEELERLQQNNQNQQPQSSFLGANSQNTVQSYFGGQKLQAQNQQQYQQNPNEQYTQRQSSGVGDFFRSVGTTAAGVAGGMLLFEGINTLFSPHSGGGFLGSSAASIPQNETIINNYYGDSVQPANQNDLSDFLDDSSIDSTFDGEDFLGGDDSF